MSSTIYQPIETEFFSTTAKEEAIYYVYILLDPRKSNSYPINEYFSLLYEPFYVGYSKNKRRFKEHLEEALNTNISTLKNSKIRSLNSKNFIPLEIKIITNLSKKEAIDLEIYFISLLGRKDKNSGYLTNMSNGGEGGDTRSGKKYRLHTPEENENNRKGVLRFNNSTDGINSRKLHSQRMSGTGNSMYGKNHTEETKIKQSTIKKGNCYGGRKVLANNVEYPSVKMALNNTNLTYERLIKKIKNKDEGFSYL